MALAMLNSGAAFQCPNNDCSGYGSQWKLSDTGDHLWVRGSSLEQNGLTFSKTITWVDLGPMWLWKLAIPLDVVPFNLDFSGTAISASYYHPFVPILIGEIPVASLGVSPTFTYIPSTNTVCGGLSVGGAIPPGGKQVSVAVFPASDPNRTKDIVGNFGWTLGAQPSKLKGFQVQVNGSGTLTGLSASTSPGIQATYGYTWCTK